MNYIIAQPDGEPELHFSPEDFFQQLKMKWPDVKIQKEALVNQGLLSHYWYRYIEDRDFEGFILDHGTGVMMRTQSGFDAIEFAMWFAEIIPNDQDLMMCDDQYTYNIILTAATTFDDLKVAFAEIDP